MTEDTRPELKVGARIDFAPIDLYEQQFVVSRITESRAGMSVELVRIFPRPLSEYEAFTVHHAAEKSSTCDA